MMACTRFYLAIAVATALALPFIASAAEPNTDIDPAQWVDIGMDINTRVNSDHFAGDAALAMINREQSSADAADTAAEGAVTHPAGMIDVNAAAGNRNAQDTAAMQNGVLERAAETLGVNIAAGTGDMQKNDAATAFLLSDAVLAAVRVATVQSRGYDQNYAIVGRRAINGLAVNVAAGDGSDSVSIVAGLPVSSSDGAQ